MSDKKNNNQPKQPEKVEKGTNLNEDRRYSDTRKAPKETSGTGPRSKKE